MNRKIDRSSGMLEEIQRRFREGPLTALRELLPDQDILNACRAESYSYRERIFDPVVTTFHFLLQALQREQSFEATCQELWTPVVATHGLPDFTFNSSATSQARSRFPRAVLDRLVKKACALDDKDFAYWEGFRLLALDCCSVSMPGEPGLFAHFGRHRARKTTVQYPLATFSALLTVGNSLLVDYGLGPLDCSETKTVRPLLDRNLAPGDLLLADRSFSNGPSCARIQRRGAHFLMRKNARLRVDKLPVLKRLGRQDFITEVPVSKDARKKDPALPPTFRLRLFKASIKTPAGERIQEWFVTSLEDTKRFAPRKLARLYHRRWQVETSFFEFKVWFHADVLRSKTVDNVISSSIECWRPSPFLRSTSASGGLNPARSPANSNTTLGYAFPVPSGANNDWLCPVFPYLSAIGDCPQKSTRKVQGTFVQEIPHDVEDGFVEHGKALPDRVVAGLGRIPWDGRIRMLGMSMICMGT